jgi:hypothetical protein
MIELPREAIEAARAKFDAHEFINYDKDRILGATTRKNVHEALSDALTAALPHLAPQSSQSDENRAWAISPGLGFDNSKKRVEILAFVVAVRAEATRDEREACAKVADEHVESVGDGGIGGEVWIATEIAAAIRARKP